ncbi:MAG: acyltransferase [Gemmatimonadaceae bacterium]
MNQTQLPERNLDVLRAIAVSCVVVDHLMWARNRGIPFVSDWDLGRVGVLLFFVHTSLVLMSSLERGGTDQGWVKRFYTRRAFRIYPLVIAAVMATVVFHIPERIPGLFVSPSPRTLASNLLLVQNLTGDWNIIGMLWTLPLEVQMYLLLPLLFLIARRSTYYALLALAGAIVFGAAVQYTSIPGLWRLSVGIFAPCFVSGVLAYAILRTKPRFHLPAWTWMPIVVAAIPLFIALRPTADRPEPGWLFCLAIGCAIPFVKELGDSLFTRAAKTICTYSYGAYLLVTPAIWIGFTICSGRAVAVQWIAFAAALVALPWAAYTFIEHPGIRIGRALAGGRRNSASLTPAP